MEDIVVSGKTYISSRRAAKESGYAQDYIGQLARKGLVESQRVGGLWYVFIDSVLEYKKNAETYKPEPLKYRLQPIIQAEIVLEERTYVSALRAAELIGYNPDYIGQLARESKVPSRQIGNRWYVDKDALIEHKREKDALLAAVQAESVGLKRPQSGILLQTHTTHLEAPKDILSYNTEVHDLIPVIRSVTSAQVATHRPESTQKTVIPIRVIDHNRSYSKSSSGAYIKSKNKVVSIPGKSIYKGIFILSTTAAILLFAVVGFSKNDYQLKSDLVSSASENMSASALVFVQSILEKLEPYMTKELVYTRK